METNKILNMKLSKSILAAVVVGASIIGSTTSCTKEDLRKKNEETEEVQPFCGVEGPERPAPYEDCPACGMG